MPHQHGTKLDGLDSVEAMRLRCVCDRHTGCWHLRTARGKPIPRGGRQIVFIHGGGTATSTRAMWAFHTGKPAPEDKIVARKCDSHDCVNPEHLTLTTRQALVKRQVKRGDFSTPQHIHNAQRAAEARRVLTSELRVWILESTQSGKAVAAALGVSQSRVNLLRQEARKRLPVAASSVFAYGQGMVANDGRMTRRA